MKAVCATMTWDELMENKAPDTQAAICGVMRV
jgi:hypothetical protein